MGGGGGVVVLGWWLGGIADGITYKLVGVI